MNERMNDTSISNLLQHQTEELDMSLPLYHLSLRSDGPDFYLHTKLSQQPFFRSTCFALWGVLSAFLILVYYSLTVDIYVPVSVTCLKGPETVFFYKSFLAGYAIMRPFRP